MLRALTGALRLPGPWSRPPTRGCASDAAAGDPEIQVRALAAADQGKCAVPEAPGGGWDEPGPGWRGQAGPLARGQSDGRRAHCAGKTGTSGEKDLIPRLPLPRLGSLSLPKTGEVDDHLTGHSDPSWGGFYQLWSLQPSIRWPGPMKRGRGVGLGTSVLAPQTTPKSFKVSDFPPRPLVLARFQGGEAAGPPPAAERRARLLSTRWLGRGQPTCGAKEQVSLIAGRKRRRLSLGLYMF